MRRIFTLVFFVVTSLAASATDYDVPITVIVNGLTISGASSSVTELAEGIILMVILYLTIQLSNHLDDAADINMALSRAGVAVQSIGKKNESLEDYFIELIHKA